MDSEEGQNASDTSEFEDHNMDYILFNEFCKYKTVIKFGSIAVPMFLTIVVLLSLLGNVLVLVILGLFENLKSLTNIFILNLALSDLIFTLGLPFWACSYIWGWTFGDFMCRSVTFVFSAGFHSSIVFLMLMSIQRYVAVVHPLFDWDGRQNFSVILIVAWVFIFVSALPAIVESCDTGTVQERKMENSEEGENANSTFGYYDCYYSYDSALIKAVSTDFPIVLTIVVLLSLIGNVLVLVMFGLFENLKSLTNIFILNLALSDLIFTLGLPFWAYLHFMWSWTFGDFMCKSVNFIFSAGFHSSIVFLMLMSIERYVAVVHPRSDWNRWQRFVFPVITWVFSFAAASPELLYSEVTPDPKDSKKHYYKTDWISSAGCRSVLILLPCDTGTVKEKKMENSEDRKYASVTSVYYGYSNNYVDNFLPTEAFSYKTVTKFGSVAVPMFFTIVVLLSLIGNILVLVILGLCKNLKSLTNIFILNLALSDLIFTLGLPFLACSYI
ncbi:hypothetical protein SRHO_G00144010 [Serrasalmus rhombeus]